MSWTKRQYVEQAFSEIGLAGYVFDLEPAQLQSALVRLDSMMAVWNGKGIRLGWPIPTGQDSSDLDDETNIPDVANEAVILGLAVRIAPSFGKALAPETKALAKMAYDLLLSIASTPIERQFPHTMPTGSGTTRGGCSPFFRSPCDPVLAGTDGVITFD